MRFASVQILHFLWLVPIMALGLIVFVRRRQKIMARFAQAHLLKDLITEFNINHYHLRNVLAILVFVLSLLALARPQWGYQWQEVKRQGLDILLVIDVSKSMLTQDVKPNRLERTKLAVRDLLTHLKGDRIGLVAFAGNAFLICPLTSDYGGFLMSLNDLDPAIIPRGGTDLGAALTEAIKGHEQTPSKYKAVIVVTDGDNLEGDPIAVARKAKELGIKIYTVGVGTSQGELIRYEDKEGKWQFIKDDQGNYVKSRLNENLLQEIAYETGGAYARSSGAEFGLDYIYREHLSQLEKREIEEKIQKKYFDRFQIPLALALLFLWIDTLIWLGVKNQQRIAR